MYRLVLVDDEPWVLSGLEELLDWEDFGFTIVGRFTDSQEAFEQICSIRPEAVITDIRMPKLTGIQLIGALKRENIEVEVVLISAYRDFEAAREALRFGACEYIMKPFDQNEVEETVRLLSEKLRGLDRPVAVDPAEPESFSTSRAMRFFREAAVYPYCRLLFSDRSDYRPTNIKDISVKPLEVKGAPAAAFLISVQSREDAFSMASDAIYYPVEGVGFSRIYPSFSSLREMLEEADHALENGFAYSYNTLAADIQLFLCRSISKNLSLADIAACFYLSEAYLSSMFKKYTGSTVTSFIQDTRTYHAARLLVRSERDVKEIAEELGYADYSYFGRLFKRRFGISPAAFRDSAGTGGH